MKKKTKTKKVFIIAEAGVNHNGSLELAFKLIDIASDAGADAVKFQTWKTEKVFTKNSNKAPYQLDATDNDENLFEMLKRLELPFGDFKKLRSYCDKRNIVFLSTADEIESATFLYSIQDIFKVGSTMLTDLPYLRKIAKFNKPVILSTGIAHLREIKKAVDTLISRGLSKSKITVLHCNSAYPSPYRDVNLLAMLKIKEALGVKVGYSDHTSGIEIPIAAAALGAAVIEKHFTIDRSMKGPDHRSSLEPGELKNMVSAIRNIEEALGDGVKRPSPSELKNKTVVRRSIVAARRIKKGDRFTEKNITTKSPETGMSPMEWDRVIGRVAKRDFEEDEAIIL
ncbi:N-acetylneuraminate synthase [Candidatus Omnitrophota bacterium]